MPAQPTEVDLVIAGLFDARTRMIWEYRTPAACIVCSRLAVAIFDSHGIPARTVPVDVRAPNIGRQVGFESGVKPRGIWNGHMVTLTDEHRVLDLTIDQLDGPQGPFAPHVFDVGPGFARGQPVTVNTPQGKLIYTAHPEDETHRLQEDWTDDPERDRLVPIVEKRIARRRADARE